jgi:hypothetical protein
LKEIWFEALAGFDQGRLNNGVLEPLREAHLIA